MPVPEGVNFRRDCKVTRIHPQQRTIETGNGETMEYDRLLVATGGVPERPAVKGNDYPLRIDHPGSSRCPADSKTAEGKKTKGHAVIAGAGPVSMETGMPCTGWA